MIKKRKNAALAWLLALSMVLPMFSSVIPSIATEATVSEDYEAKTIQEILDLDKSLTWVFAGDSITHNAGWSGGMNSYSEWFEQYLYDIGRGDDSVVLTAWGGASSYDFQPEGEKYNGLVGKDDPGATLEHMITKYNPDVVFIKLGMNSRKAYTENIIGSYNTMLDELYEDAAAYGKRPKVVLLSPTPLSDETYYDDQVHTEARTKEIAGSVKRVSDLYADIAEERGLTFIDLRTAFIEESLRLGEDYSRTFYSDSSDGTIHPNAAGQYYIFKTLCSELGIDDETMPIFQLEYDDILSQAMYVDSTAIADYTGDYGSTTGWESIFTENYVWAVAGAQQMSGYEGPIPHRSMFRFIDNALRYNIYRDIRLYNFASPAYTNGVSDLVAKYDTTMATRDYNVFLLLPEVPNSVYTSGNTPTEEELDTYEANVRQLLTNNENAGKTCILWTPLASGDSTINSYIDAYAARIRAIIAEDTDASILFFDANQFMNDKMTSDTSLSLTRNWFEDGAYVSPLCANDVVYAFYTQMAQSGTGMNALKNRNLRYSTDTQVFKGNYVRDYVKADATVSGTTVTVDVTAIKEAYADITELWFAVMPGKATGDYHADMRLLSDVTTVAESGNVYTFEAPCADLYLAVYAKRESDIFTYRFKDISLAVTTDATISETTPTPDGVYLNSLEVMSAPDFGFDKNTTEYTVNLYQYQTYVTLRATAQAGLTITVNGETVASGALSKPIKVEDGSKITVAVTDGTTTKTYTLTCSKPQQPDIIITEVMQDGYASYTVANSNDNYELVEIYNASGKDLNLLDYSLGFKKDYTYNNITESNSAEYPYYFTGNDQAFGGDASYTGIKPITKYSVYWADKVNEEPTEVIFKADSTMVIWIRSTPQSTEEARAEHGATLTYDTLRAALEAHKGTHTLTVDVDGVETAVVPQESQLVVAEVEDNVKSAVLTNRAQKTAEVASTTQNYVMDNFTGIYNASTATRGWLFMLKNTAEFAKNGAITEAGNDIITAAKFSRVAKTVDDETVGTDKLSSVFSYNYSRGMSVVRNENVVNVDTIGEGNTSDVMGYSNLTSFGAIEYWQKPNDFGDATAPTIVDNTERNLGAAQATGATISLDLADEQDLRYIEVYTRKTGETEFTKASKDYVLETCVASAGVATDVKSATYSYTIADVGEEVEYYVKAVDGNNNVTTLGSEENPLIISTLRTVESYSAEDATALIGVEAPDSPSTDYVFAGWYADEACVNTPIRSAEGLPETVYALFVSKDVLQAKAQISSEVYLSDTNTTPTYADMRFITTVDTLRYKEVGFKFVINGEAESYNTNIVYTRLNVVKDVHSETGEEIDPITPDYFSSASNYFAAFTFTGIPEEDWSTEIYVTPYWKTLDGTVVTGTEVMKTVNQGKADSVARIGTEYYSELSHAVEAADTGDTIELLKDTTVDKTIAVDKAVTITNEAATTATITRAETLTDAMFTVDSGAGLTIAGTSADYTLTVDGNKDNVVATSSMIDNAGTFNLGTNASLTNAGHTSLEFGGALYNTGTVALEGTISGNIAERGGAIYNSAGTVTFNDGIYQSNNASAHGAVIFSLKGKVDIIDGTFSSNTADDRAGVILSNGATVTISGGEFSQNTASGATGGGVFGGTSTAKLEITGGNFHDNQATAGGGVIESNGTVTINGGTFEENSAFEGGVFYMNTSGALTINAGEFYSNETSNQTDAAGGVIYISKNTLSITGGTFGAEGKGNVSYQRGGAIYIADRDTAPEEANISIKNATFSYNSAQHGTKASGGMMFVGANSNVDIEACTIDHNEVVDTNTSTNGIYYLGGVMYVSSAVVNVTGTSFSYNKAGTGGVIYVTESTSQLTVIDSDFSNNAVTAVTSSGTDVDGLGGVIYVNKATVEIKDNSTFTGNSAFRGGAIGLGNSGALTLSDCEFEDNSATGNFGRDIIYNSGSLTLSGKIGNAQIDKRDYEINVKGELDSASKIEIKQISGASGIVQVRFESAAATEIGAQCISYYGYYSTVNSGLTLQFDTENCYAIMQ